MNNSREIAEAGGKAFIKNLVRVLPLGGTAVSIYEELQSKQIKRKIQRLEEFYSNLAATIEAQKEQINQEFVNKDDFLDVFEEATRYVVLERQADKRRQFKNILTNSIISSDCDYDKTERYFKLLHNLSELELKVLAVLDNPEQYNKTHGMIIEDPTNALTPFPFNHVIASGVITQLLGLKIHEAEEAATVLFSNGLTNENFLNRQLHSNQNPIHVLDNLLTIRGRDFVRYLKDQVV